MTTTPAAVKVDLDFAQAKTSLSEENALENSKAKQNLHIQKLFFEKIQTTTVGLEPTC
jgi:hypothetical protein